MLEHTLGFVGAGQMARALARGFLAGQLLSAEQLAAYDPAPEALSQFAAEFPHAVRADHNRSVVEFADVVILAVKPQSFRAVAQELTGLAGRSPGKLFLSILAGVPLPALCQGLGTDRMVRVMPNTPCLVGQGASAYACGSGVTAADQRLVEQLLGAVGVVYALPEKLLDAVTGLSGSGPAYVYMLIEALSDGGVRAGLPRTVATALAAQTMLGAAQMVLTTGEHPGVLKDRVASPGGTTMAGLQVLERRGVRSAMIDAVEAATVRSQELAAQG